MTVRAEESNRFRERLNAIVKRSADYQKNLSKKDPVWTLLDKFVAFSKEYVELLKQVPPEISRYPFVVNNGIERLLQEWNKLSRASEQRLIKGFESELKNASELAQSYCDRWNAIVRDNLYHELKAPVVYFEKMFRISRSIYAPEIPIISIPLTEYDQPENWQSLAHEFSHHIFWNGFDVDSVREAHQNLRNHIENTLTLNASASFFSTIFNSNQLENRIVIWKNWVEEVFADVYGTLLAGPAYAISSQNRIAERINRVDDFIRADYEHPCDYLRPWISLQVLDEIASQINGNSSALDLLKERWLKFSEGAGELKYEKISLASLKNDVKPIVRVILEVEKKFWPVQVQKLELVKITEKDWSVKPADLIPITGDGFPEIPFSSLDEIKLPDSFEEIKQYLRVSSNQIVRGMRSNKPEQDAKLLAWSALLGLELSQSGGYHVHGCTPSSDHVHVIGWWWSGHRHNSVSNIEQCNP